MGHFLDVPGGGINKNNIFFKLYSHEFYEVNLYFIIPTYDMG